jgi:hemerythrin-like domain-containing protein
LPVDDTQLTDVSDMAYMHRAFRRGLAEARGQMAFINDGDTARAAHFADYIRTLLWLLHAHHAGEDELLYPLLVERVPEQAELFARMDAQHASVESNLHAATEAATAYGDSGSAADAEVLADACEALLALLGTHLTEEEVEVLPVAARTITPDEWAKLPGHVLMAYRGDRIWLPFGLATEAFPQPIRDAIVSGPSPIGPIWLGGGSAAFANEMRLIRDETAWANR